MELKKESIRNDFSMLALLVIPVAVAVNFVGGQLAYLLKLPLYLDAIGTIFGSILLGPWVGAVIGLLNNVVKGLTNPVAFAYAPTSIALGLLTGYLARRKMFTKIWKTIISLILMALISIVVSAPISVLLYGGITGGGPSMITAAVMATGRNIWVSFMAGEGLFNAVDRVISLGLCLAIIKVLPERTLIKFSLGENFIKKKIA